MNIDEKRDALLETVVLSLASGSGCGGGGLAFLFGSGRMADFVSIFRGLMLLYLVNN